MRMGNARWQLWWLWQDQDPGQQRPRCSLGLQCQQVWCELHCLCQCAWQPPAWANSAWDFRHCFGLHYLRRLTLQPSDNSTATQYPLKIDFSSYVNPNQLLWTVSMNPVLRLGIEDLRSFGSTALTNCPKLLVCEHSNAILIPLKTDLASCLGVGRIFIFIAAV